MPTLVKSRAGRNVPLHRCQSPVDAQMFAAIVIPQFALQAVLRHAPELHSRPVAVMEEEDCPHAPREGFLSEREKHHDDHEDAQRAGRTKILQLTAAARAHHVICGMTTSQAQARCPDLVIRARSSEAERSAQAALLEAAFQFSSFVEETGPGVCTVELVAAASSAPPPSDDPNAAAARRILAHLSACHLHAQIGVAPNPELAHLAAESAAPFRKIHSAAELADLTIEQLVSAPSLLDLLRRWGVRTLGAFVALGRAALVARLGSEIVPFYDRAIGAKMRPLRCVQPAESFEESIEFEHEIESLQPLLFILRRLLDQIVLRLGTVYRVAAELTLRLGFRDGREHERLFKIPSPTHDAEVLFRMVHTHLENFTAEQPIVRLQLIAKPIRPARQQFGLFESALRDPNQFAETLARLVALLGHDRVGTPELAPTHRPDAFRLRPADFTSPARSASVAALPLGLVLRRFRPPQPALVRLAHAPAHVEAAAARGPVTAAYGPMILSGDWWAPQPWSRREWDVQLADGQLCRIFEEEGGGWFLEGVYD